MKNLSPISTIMACGIALLLASCETYEYMRDPDAPRRAELLERSALIAEAETNMPPERVGEDGLPIYGPAAFYNEFPEGTNPPASSTTPLPERADTPGSASDGSDEYERWVIGPDGLLVPASSLEKNTPESDGEEETEADNTDAETSGETD